MIADCLKPYSSYRDSGVPWLGIIPADWHVKRNKLLLHETDDRSTDGSEELLTVSQYTGVTKRRDRLTDDNDLLTNAGSLVGYKRVSLGDLVINIMLAWNGSLGVSDIEGIVSPAYSVFRPNMEIVPKFLHYLYRTPLMTGIFKTVSTGVVDSRLRLYPEVFLRLPSVLPPIDEQRAIIRFLDHVSRHINRYIRAKQKLITLLNEQKQAIIHNAITRGLHPNVRLRPSGIEWLGDVPERWEVIALGRLIRLATGFPFKSKGFSSSEGDIRLLRGINVAPGIVRWDEVVRWPAAQAHEFSNYELKVGDIVLGMDRTLVSGGTRVALVGEEDVPSLLLQRVARIRPLERLDCEYALMLLQGKSFSDYLRPIFTGISVPHLSPEQISSFRIALPSVSEQRQIVRSVQESTRNLSTAISTARREIGLLREYRTRLIADAVTGKLDVREAVASLPAEADALDAFDAGASGELAEESQDFDSVLQPEEADA